MSPYSGPFGYDHVPPFSAFHSPGPESSFRLRRPSLTRNSNSRPNLSRSWSNKSGRDGYPGKDFMSERAAGHGQPGSSASGSDASRIYPNPSQPYQRHGQQSSEQGAPPSSNATEQSQNPSAIQLPPLPQAANVTSGSFPPPRSTGFSSILNPSADNEPTPSRRRKADQLESPSSVKSLPPIFRNDPAGPSRSRPAHVQTSAANEQFNRPTLTPRSPSYHRGPSSYHINPPTATIPADQSPFPISPRTRAYTIEPGGPGAPSNPNPAEYTRQTHTFTAPTPPPPKPRRVSTGMPRMRGQSSSASPGTSYSGFSRSGRTSPGQHHATNSGMPTLASSYSVKSEGPTSGPNTSSAQPEFSSLERQRQLGIPISSASGQNSYQMMTLETTSGTVQLPVDVQAASRVADEKRRRNAGASARFRQRRKEKERESSTTISKLEQQVKALGEDADFYKRERDYFAGVILQIPGGDRHFPRPQSPRHRRSSSVFASGSGSQGYGSGTEMGPQSPDQGRNVRRRTSTVSLPPQAIGMQGPQSGQPLTPRFAAAQGYMIAPAPPQHQQYQSAPGPLPSPLGRMSVPGSANTMPAQPHHHPPQQPPQQPPQLMQATPQTGPWNPYATERRPPHPPHSQSYDGRQ